MAHQIQGTLIATLLGGLFCVTCPQSAFSQDAQTAFDVALTAPENPWGYAEESSSESTNLESLQRRLEQAESQLEELQKSKEAEDDDKFSQLKDYWKCVKDPAIVDVCEQAGHESAEGKEWYERLSIRGYAQFRYNHILEEDESQAPAQHASDRSVGENQSFFIRRARLIVSGDVSDHMYVYLQSDFASSVSGVSDSIYYAQMRDWYADLFLDTTKVYRVRIGQSKIPFGWENMQSSSNRLPLDRSDVLNEAANDQRDLGLFFYWTPEEAQELFKYVLEEGLKGSGNYGVLGLGIYNGQGGSTSEQNDNLHVIARLAYPFRLQSGQIVEWNLHGYTGKFSVLSDPIRPLGIGPPRRPLGTIETGDENGIRDERVGVAFIWYPQPWGFQAEWNEGRAPGLNEAQTAVIDRPLSGGYAMTMYRYETESCGTVFPFARFSYNSGGFKTQANSPFGHVHEYDLGVEWQFNPQMELVTQYTMTDRTNVDAMDRGRSYDQFEGELLRAHFQINY